MLLTELSAGTRIDADTLQCRARWLLRHFPRPIDMEVSADVMSDVWSRAMPGGEIHEKLKQILAAKRKGQE